MAKLTGPLLSFGAKGQIGKAMVVAKWRGIDYARSYVKPANPRTTAQQANRTRFAFLRELWKRADAVVKAPWDAFSAGRPFTGANKIVGENNRLVKLDDHMQNAVMSPGARGGLPPTGVVVTTGDNTGEVKVQVGVPEDLPEGWMLDGVAVTAIHDQDPKGIFYGPFPAATDPAGDDPLTLGGFNPGEDVVGYGWVIYSKPDGSKAYSVSLADTASAAA